MSIKLMAGAWDLDIPSTEKMVLLCLCDFSNDHGSCWPSISTIAAKCSKSERTVQGAIKWLRDEGFCDWIDAPGKSHQFRLNPRKICTPAKSAPPQLLQEPPQNLRPTPAELAPKPSRTIKEPSNRGEQVKQPVGVSDDVWRDFCKHRKKYGAITPTVIAGFQREADKAGYTLEQAMEESITQGWRGFKADWVAKRDVGQASNSLTAHLLAKRGNG